MSLYDFTSTTERKYEALLIEQLRAEIRALRQSLREKQEENERLQAALEREP